LPVLVQEKDSLGVGAAQWGLAVLRHTVRRPVGV